MGRRSRKENLKESKFKRSGKRLVYGVVSLVTIGTLVGTLVVASYFQILSPPIPKSVVKAADLAVASVPFLPKNPQQVLTKALFETSRINSGKHNFTLRLFEESPNNTIKEVLDLNIAGPFKKEKNQIDLAGTANLKLPDRDSSKVNFIELDDFIYFKVENPPQIPSLDLKNLNNSWYKADITKLTADIKADTKPDYEIEKTISEKIKSVLNLLESSGKFKHLSNSEERGVSGTLSYNYKVTLDKDEAKSILTSLGDDNVPDFQEAEINIWVDKESFYINKLSVSGALAGSGADSVSAEVLAQLPRLNLDLVYELKDANADVAIEPPATSEELGSLLDLYSLVSPDSKDHPADFILGATSNLGEFGANFLTIERLLHVLYLTPQAF